MSHAVYQTKAFIIKIKNMRESNKLVYLYTEKFGLLYASMQSVREMRSKMKTHVQCFSVVDVDIIAGRSIWRIVGIHEDYSSFCLVGTPWYRLVSLVSDMILRLCVGEEQNEKLWFVVDTMFQNFSLEHISHVHEYEILTMSALLNSLGYWQSGQLILPYNKSLLYHQDNFLYIKKNKINFIKKINQSLIDSQL